jgi:hypothetical protein
MYGHGFCMHVMVCLDMVNYVYEQGLLFITKGIQTTMHCIDMGNISNGRVQTNRLF